MYCAYYRANIDKIFCWYVTAILKSYEHLAFDRTIDTATNLFEFYVPQEREEEFVRLMHYFAEQQLIHNFAKAQNRLMDPNQEL